MINSNMRAGIPPEKHDSVLTHYGDALKYRKELSMDDKNLEHLFLVDKEDFIRFKGKGYAEKKKIKKILKISEQGCHKKQ